MYKTLSEGTLVECALCKCRDGRTDITLNRGLVWSSQMLVFKWCWEVSLYIMQFD